MQAFNSVPTPTETGKVVEWHRSSVAQSYCCELKFGYVHVHDIVSRILKSTISLTAFLLGHDSYFCQHCLFFCAVKKMRYTVRGRLFSSTIFCLTVMYSSHPPTTYFFFLCSVLAVVLPSLLSTMTTVLPLGHHLPFIQHFFSFPFAHSFAQAAA